MLVGIVGRIANDDRYFLGILFFDTLQVFGRDRGKQAALLACIAKAHIVEGIYKDEVLKFFVFPYLLFVGKLYVQVGYVVGQDAHFIGTYFVFVLVFDLLFLGAWEVVNQISNESACTCGRVENLYAFAE